MTASPMISENEYRKNVTLCVLYDVDENKRVMLFCSRLFGIIRDNLVFAKA